MPTTKENYQIQATDMNGLVMRLNSALARISDRLDKIEGLRGELETESGTFGGNVVSAGSVTGKSVVVNDADSETPLHSME
jgi:hypothetical protein